MISMILPPRSCAPLLFSSNASSNDGGDNTCTLASACVRLPRVYCCSYRNNERRAVLPRRVVEAGVVMTSSATGGGGGSSTNTQSKGPAELTVAELREECRRQGLQNISKLKKDELIRLLKGECPKRGYFRSLK